MKAAALGSAPGARMRDDAAVRQRPRPRIAPCVPVTGRRAAPWIAAAVVATAGLAGCSGAPDDGSGAEGAPPVHVHGMGVNPADGSLYVATHTGLFHAAPGSDDVARIDDRRQDTMGFAVAGPDRFIGSGHPDLREDLPPLLGLIESTDAGGTWRSVSLLGDADFHSLAVSGDRVYGYDATGERFMASTDGGRTWRASAMPPVESLAVDPSDPRRVMAATVAGLLVSGDGGRGWAAMPGLPGLLAWPERDRLYSVYSNGEVQISRDGGRSWSARGSVPGDPAALTALDGATLIVALHEGGFASSDDGGATWAAGPWPS